MDLDFLISFQKGEKVDFFVVLEKGKTLETLGLIFVLEMGKNSRYFKLRQKGKSPIL